MFVHLQGESRDRARMTQYEPADQEEEDLCDFPISDILETTDDIM